MGGFLERFLGGALDIERAASGSPGFGLRKRLPGMIIMIFLYIFILQLFSYFILCNFNSVYWVVLIW